MAKLFNSNKISDMKYMGPGLTIREIATHLGITSKTAAKRLETAGRKPREYVGRTALYEQADEDAIKDVQMGRPPKKPAATPDPE
jgi:hypothetical protein